MTGTVVVPLLGGGRVTISEPAWCRADHTTPVSYRQDIAHEGAEISLTVDTALGRVEVLPYAVDQWPFSDTGERLPRAVVGLSGSGWTPFRPQNLRDFADRLVQHAARLREFAALVEQLRAEAGEPR